MSFISNFFKYIFSFFSKKDTSTIYIGNLVYSFSASDLNDLFSACGSIENSRIIRDQRTKRSKGYGFITFNNADSAKHALSYEGRDVKGRKIVVRLANQR